MEDEKVKAEKLRKWRWKSYREDEELEMDSIEKISFQTEKVPPQLKTTFYILNYMQKVFHKLIIKYMFLFYPQVLKTLNNREF